MVDYDTLSDILLGGLFAVSVAVSAGVASVSLLDVSLAEVIWTMDPLTVDWASAISIAILLTAYLTHMPDLSRMSSDKSVLLLLTVGIIVLGMLDPGYAANQAVIGLLGVGISAGGYWAIQYQR